MLEFINYDELLLWLSFAFCLSLTTAGVLVLFRIAQVRRTVALQYLQYFLILLYVFGYYSLWSTILMSHFLDIENVERLTTILSQMGVPFFVICLVMQLLWAIKTQTNPSKLIFPAALLLSVVVVVIVLQSPWPIGDSVRADLALAADGGLFVADGYGDRVQAFAPGGAFSHKWGGPFAMNVFGPFNGWFATVTSIAVGPEGNVFVADFYNDRVQKFAPDGTFLTAFGESGDSHGQINHAIAVAVADDGSVFVADFLNNRIEKWRPGDTK